MESVGRRYRTAPYRARPGLRPAARVPCPGRQAARAGSRARNQASASSSAGNIDPQLGGGDLDGGVEPHHRRDGPHYLPVEGEHRAGHRRGSGVRGGHGQAVPDVRLRAPEQAERLVIAGVGRGSTMAMRPRSARAVMACARSPPRDQRGNYDGAGARPPGPRPPVLRVRPGRLRGRGAGGPSGRRRAHRLRRGPQVPGLTSQDLRPAVLQDRPAGAGAL